MIELLRRQKHKIKDHAIPYIGEHDRELHYKKDQFFSDYKGSLTRKKYSAVCDTFFRLATEFVLKGGFLHTPFGLFKVQRRKLTRSYVDFGKLRNRTNANDENIFKDKPYYDWLSWDQKLHTGYLRPYDFEETFQTHRAIPKFDNERTYKWKKHALLQSNIS
jgi:hypothetical protein